jgi:enoyl-CoA hydratase
MKPYSYLQGITVEVSDAIAHMTLQFQGEDSDTRRAQHRELTEIWRDLDADGAVRVVLLTGVGDEFFLSGRPPGRGPSYGDSDASWEFALYLEREVGAIVREMTRFSKPVVAAVNGAAAGAGLAVAMLSDISLIADDAWLVDPHIMLGIAAGDGPGALLPLYIGIAKAKLYLLTSDAISGPEAERIGLMGRSVARVDLMPLATDYAVRLSNAPPTALRFTKRALNQWIRLAELIAQDYALTLETLTFFSPDRAGAPHTEWPPRTVP